MEEETEIKVYSNQKSVTLFVDDVQVGTITGEHVFKFNVKISGVHKIKAVSGNQVDEMEIAKVSEPNPNYFASAEEVRNWFDEPQEEFETPEGYLSLNSSMGEIGVSPEGKAVLDKLMSIMTSKTAGGMGAGVEMTPSMQAMIARQPLKKLLTQVGMDLNSPEVIDINTALNQIKR